MLVVSLHVHAGQLKQLLDARPLIRIMSHHHDDQLPQLRGQVLGKARFGALFSQIFPLLVTLGQISFSRHLKHDQSETEHVTFRSKLGS